MALVIIYALEKDNEGLRLSNYQLKAKLKARCCLI